MKLPDFGELAARAVVAVCIFIAAGQVLAAFVERVGIVLFPLIALGIAAWAIWISRYRI